MLIMPASCLYRNARWIFSQVKWNRRVRRDYRNNLQLWGAEYAKICRDCEITKHKSDPVEKQLVYCNRKKEYILLFLIDDLRLKEVATSTRTGNEDIKEIPKIIWVFWWDGFNTAPVLVKACVASIQKAAGNDVDVVLLDRNNYSNYVQLPEDIIRKHDRGIIGHAHYSDIVRLSLLAEYGGFWMDATIFCSRPLPKDIWEYRFFTCKQDEEDPLVPSRLKWAGWLLGGVPGFPLFSFARDALITFWQHCDSAIDYLLMDYVFELAYEQVAEVRQTIDQLPGNNVMRHELMKRINEPYRAEFFETGTYIYKLSYHYGKPRRFTNDGERTFYGFITQEIEKT